ncbi:restriction endonuclease, partial [Escherichia coli]|nr:restriction endonuclease [Escherichia coli]
NGISRRRKEDTNEGDIVLRLQDVHYSGIAFDKELNRIKLVDKEKQIARVEHDDLLFIRVNGNPNYVGRTAVFKSYIEPVYHNDHLIR